jgi:hypothetical protein
MNVGRSVGSRAIASRIQYSFEACYATAFAIGAGNGNDVASRSCELHTSGNTPTSIKAQLNLAGVHSGDVLEPGI